MDITTLKDKLDETQFTALQGYVTTLANQRDEARNESIAGRKTLKAEVEKLRGIKETLFDKLGLDDDADISSIQIPTKGAELEATKQYERKLKKLEADLAASQESYTGLEGKYRGSMLDAQLTKAISAHDFVDSDLVAEYIKTRTKFEDGELLYLEGDKALSIDEGVKLIATQKPHMLRSQGATGSGFNPTATSGKVKSFSEMTLSEKNDLYKQSPEKYQAAKAAA